MTTARDFARGVNPNYSDDSIRGLDNQVRHLAAFVCDGTYKCRACGRRTDHPYDDPQSTASKPTCANLTCRGTCDAVGPTVPDVGEIIAYEEGGLSDAETIDLFQRLINCGLAWKLQGHYGRTARELIEAGWCKVPNHPFGDRASRKGMGLVP